MTDQQEQIFEDWLAETKGLCGDTVHPRWRRALREIDRLQERVSEYQEALEAAGKNVDGLMEVCERQEAENEELRRRIKHYKELLRDAESGQGGMSWEEATG